MSDQLLWRARSLLRLRGMLRHLILEEHATRNVDLERAAHLADAVADLRTLIARLETESCLAIFSTRRPSPKNATLQPDSTEQPLPHRPPAGQTVTHAVEPRV
jgi:hypothetical protein